MFIFLIHVFWPVRGGRNRMRARLLRPAAVSAHRGCDMTQTVTLEPAGVGERRFRRFRQLPTVRVSGLPAAIRAQPMRQRRSLHPMPTQVHPQPLDRLVAGAAATASGTGTPARHDPSRTARLMISWTYSIGSTAIRRAESCLS